MLFNPYFEICSLGFLIVLFLYFFRRDNMLDTSSTLYAVFIVVAVFNLCFDIISAYTLTYAAQVPAWVNMVVNPLYLATQIVLCAIFMLYTMALVNYLTHEHRKTILLLLLPAAILALFILLSPMHNYIVYIDAAFNYVHGSFYNLIYLVAFFYILSGLFFVSRYRQRVIRLQFNTIVAYVVMTVAAVSFQYFYPQYLISGMAVTIAIMMMFLTFQNPENFTDNLTGLYAAPAFPLTLDKLINNRKEYGMVVIDINNLKFVNTIYGIQGGDELLVQIGAFMMSSFGTNNAFRIKGDRFVGIYMPNSKIDGETVRKRFEESWNLSGSEAVISVSICQIPMSQYASNRDDVMAIMESATLMLKTMDRGAYLDIDRQTADTLYRRLSVESALQYAIRHRTLNVYYQPICSVQTGKIVGAEALVRLYDTRLGNIPPEEFIIVAEQMGMIKEVGEVVIEIASKFVADNRLWERNVGMMHINLSTLQCMEYKLSEHILAIFAQYGVPADMFSFEITESAAIASEAQLLNTMNELIPHGVKFAMDDYGSGYSNSTTIIRFPFHAIKIDKSMLWGSTGSEKARVIYSNTVNMIRQMNLQIISEGVETAEQADLLKRLGVNYVQGFFFSRPLPGEKFLQYLAEQSNEA